MDWKRVLAITLAYLCISEPVGVDGAIAQESEQNATKPATSPCAGGRFREFDFWIGEWDVRGADGKIAGANAISSEENGCVIVERWQSAGGGSGQSLNYFDPADNRWKQDWIGLGLILHMQGEMRNGAMVLEGPLQYLGQNRITRLRGTWTQLEDGRVRQLFEESSDGGKNWETWFDGYYTRRTNRRGSPAAACGSVERLRALDFWHGRWTVFSEEQKVGTNIIERVLDGCAVTERWTDVEGHEGLSLFYFDADADLWKQVWVTDNSLRVGGTKEKAEQRHLTSESQIRFRGRYPGAKPGVMITDQTTLTRMGDGSVRQLIEVSTDGGQSWRTTFDGHYRNDN